MLSGYVAYSIIWIILLKEIICSLKVMNKIGLTVTPFECEMIELWLFIILLYWPNLLIYYVFSLLLPSLPYFRPPAVRKKAPKTGVFISVDEAAHVPARLKESLFRGTRAFLPLCRSLSNIFFTEDYLVSSCLMPREVLCSRYHLPSLVTMKIIVLFMDN